jgi:hypothetical protein
MLNLEAKVIVRRLSTVILASAILHGSALESGSLLAQVVESRCDPAYLGRAEMVDTATLEKTVREGMLFRTGQGLRLEAYNRGDTLNVLVVTIIAETAYATASYYFLSPQDYVVNLTSWHYDKPSSEGAKVVSRSTQYFYFCEGELVDPDYARKARLVKQLFEEDAVRLLEGG